jgi:flagellin-like hook-associated protein FlgL
MTIVPLGLGRSSVPLQTNRAYSNLTGSTAALAKAELQLYTQRQYQHGSDSPFNATATLSVLTELERKTQNASNLQYTQTFLTATSSVLSKFNFLTDDVRDMALNALNTTTSAEQRTALAQTVSQTLQSLFDFANNSFGGRYLFSGATTAAIPFAWGTDSSYTVKYTGNVNDLWSWSDTDLLSKSNMNGVDVFGAISDPMRGADLNPALHAKTLLSDLNGGKGVEKGTIRFTYTVDNREHVLDVDLSRCVTVGDVQKTIENSKNPYFNVNVDITANGLVLSVPESTVGSVTVSEVGRGTTARQLGLAVKTEFNRNKPLVSKDLNPALTKTTRLTDLLGTKSSLELRFSGANNDILIQANHNGSEYDGLNVSLQADSTIIPGEERVEYNKATGELLVWIHPDNTSANDIIKAINDSPIPYTASLSGKDQQRSEHAGTGIVPLLPGVPVAYGATSGGSGADLDLAGIELVNDNAVWSISFEDCKTIGDILAELNDPKYGLYAAINDAKNGIDIRSRVSGADFCIGENGGTTASQLGVRSLDLDTRLEALDFGRGVSDYTGPGMHASATYVSKSDHSTLLLTARNEGKDWNDYTLEFVPTHDPQGKVTVALNEETKKIIIGINPGVTTACEIVSAFEAQPGPKQFFDLQLDETNGLNNGGGVVYDGFINTSGGTNGGIDFLITRNDGTILEIDIHGAETMADVLRIINEHPDNWDGLLTASLSKTGNGIELVDKSFGDKVTRVDRTLLSTAAIELGLVNPGEEYRTKTTIGEIAYVTMNSDVMNGALLITANSVGTYANDAKAVFVEGAPPGFIYDASSKTLFFMVESGVTTANDVVELFQAKASEQVRAMFAVLNSVNDDGLPSDGSGLITLDTGTLAGGTDSELKGNDPNPQETTSLFNALIRMQIGMEKNDTREIERATQLLDAAVARLDAAQATLGVMQSNLDRVASRLSDEAVQFEETLNITLRIEYSAASLTYLNQQMAYQGALQVTSMMFQMSLMNYL